MRYAAKLTVTDDSVGVGLLKKSCSSTWNVESAKLPEGLKGNPACKIRGGLWKAVLAVTSGNTRMPVDVLILAVAKSAPTKVRSVQVPVRPSSRGVEDILSKYTKSCVDWPPRKVSPEICVPAKVWNSKS